jgi:hypothetical protein
MSGVSSSSGQESILPNFDFFVFPIFIVKLECLKSKKRKKSLKGLFPGGVFPRDLKNVTETDHSHI